MVDSGEASPSGLRHPFIHMSADYQSSTQRSKMTTRRIVSDEKTYLDDDGKGASEPSIIAPAVPSCVPHLHSLSSFGLTFT